MLKPYLFFFFNLPHVSKHIHAVCTFEVARKSQLLLPCPTVYLLIVVSEISRPISVKSQACKTHNTGIGKCKTNISSLDLLININEVVQKYY